MTQEATDATECNRHHWQIESPNGPVSIGKCKICGERREFNNSIQGSGWDRQGSHNRRLRQSKAAAAANSNAKS